MVNHRTQASMSHPPRQDESLSPAQELGIAVQLVRANNLTMTRFQLALQSGDRRLAMMALDGLLDIDAEMAVFVEGWAAAHPNALPMQAIAEYLIDQKDAIATEKHVLAGQVGKSESSTPRPVEEVAVSDDRIHNDERLDRQLPAIDIRLWLIALIAVCVTVTVAVLAIR